MRDGSWGKRVFATSAAGGLIIGLALGVSPALAAEGGASLYLLWSGGPEAAVMPPLQGVFFNNQAYYYSGSAGGGKDFVIGGKVVAGLNANIPADFITALWVPTTHFAGGTLAIGGALPFGVPQVNVSAVITGPGGNVISRSVTDTAWVIGDPIVTAALGWKRGNYHVQLSSIVNIPVGEYRDPGLANLAFHRWAGDGSLALTWHDDKSGWDVSGKSGFTFNGTNNVTQYTTGTEFHLEGSVEKRLSPSWALGVQTYYLRQVTGDSGPGAKLGSFEGEVAGVGGTASYAFKLGKMPATARISGFDEFDATNRLQGYSLWLGLTVPLTLKLPAGPHAGS